MSDIVAPTCEQICDKRGFGLVHTTREPWRHGNYVTAVYLREADKTYWKVLYALSTDGETNELREGGAEISRCWPFQKMVTAYLDTPPNV